MDNKNRPYQDLVIQHNASVLDALKQMDLIGRKLLIVTCENKFFSLISIGDIQRAIIKNIVLETEISKLLRKNVYYAKPENSTEEIKKVIWENKAEYCPVVSETREIAKVYFWEDFFPGKAQRTKAKLNIPVVIMAGGKGSRLKPLTHVLPKPLLPIQEKTIIEEIMDKFLEVGCDQFYISVNYKAEMIRHYFKTLAHPQYKISYFEEKSPLGTVGSLYLLKGKIDSTFFISNCDIIIEEDYSEIYQYHKEQKNELTMVAALKNYAIPYGTIETGKNGTLKALKEKPLMTFQINSGLYLLEPHLLEDIPDNKFFHITQLIENVMKRKGKVGVFPISEGSWKDIGEWDEYLKTILHHG